MVVSCLFFCKHTNLRTCCVRYTSSTTMAHFVVSSETPVLFYILYFFSLKINSIMSYKYYDHRISKKAFIHQRPIATLTVVCYGFFSVERVAMVKIGKRMASSSSLRHEVHLLHAAATFFPATAQTGNKHTQERLPLATYSSYLRRKKKTRVRRSSSLKHPPSTIPSPVLSFTIDQA